MAIRPFQLPDEPAVIELWHRCGLVRPPNDPAADVRRKLLVQPHMFLVAEAGGDGAIAGTIMAGYEGHRGCINYLAVSPDHRRRGIGRALVREAERLLVAAGCPKVNLQVRTTNAAVVEFYRRIGFTVDDVISLGKRLRQDA